MRFERIGVRYWLRKEARQETEANKKETDSQQLNTLGTLHLSELPGPSVSTRPPALIPLSAARESQQHLRQSGLRCSNLCNLVLKRIHVFTCRPTVAKGGASCALRSQFMLPISNQRRAGMSHRGVALGAVSSVSRCTASRSHLLFFHGSTQSSAAMRHRRVLQGRWADWPRERNGWVPKQDPETSGDFLRITI